ncbi:MAG: BatD family protein [Planctomycetaceae bacterium]
MLKQIRIMLSGIIHVVLLLCGMATVAAAGDVEARLSAREAFVGMPVVLQLSINNAADYEQPAMPGIDGCDIRSAGNPSQSSRVTVINGRRSESRSVTMQYLITPRREGTFEIPSISVKVDGRDMQTAPLRFVATKSETGDLLFVEVDGGGEKVFVGEPLELTLKIWLKPYRDAEHNVTLSEGSMWQMISDQTLWGSFAERLTELSENNQRPAGQEVLRDDAQGNPRSYYLYEITATIYPKRPGRIDADDVQIVVNYPTALGRSRDPFAGFFDDSAFGRRSPLSQMLSDDLFGSRLGSRLTVTSARPIVGEATVDATEVVPVPTEGRPPDYRGAVGRYGILTQATPTSVSAGDAITLNIGITGTGPMELVQAPPLSELPALTADFKVADQSLAGFVQDNTKLFSTTIRPLREGITQIPAIPFSYFDPDTGTYETAMSDPIAITVTKSETLSLDAIVGVRAGHAENGDDTSAAGASPKPDFTNDNSERALLMQTSAGHGIWWWYFVIIPPGIWLSVLLARSARRFDGLLPELLSPRKRCLKDLAGARQPSAITQALVRYIILAAANADTFRTSSCREPEYLNLTRSGYNRRIRQSCSTADSAVGVLRTTGLASVANSVEEFFERCERLRFTEDDSSALDEFRRSARELVDQIENAVHDAGRTRVRGSTRRAGDPGRGIRRLGRTGQQTTGILLAVLVSLAGTNAFAVDTAHDGRVTLTKPQQQAVLKEAGELYSNAVEIGDANSLDARDLFAKAAAKYQLLLDTGIRNSVLYRNLGNAYLQSGEPGRAIASYERAAVLDSSDSQLMQNLKFARSLVSDVTRDKSPADSGNDGGMISLRSIADGARAENSELISVVGLNVVLWLVVLSSVAFWGIQVARAAGIRRVSFRFAVLPLVLLAVSLTSAILATTSSAARGDGIVVVNTLTLRAGDGSNFDSLQSLENAVGSRVTILAGRGPWLRVQTRDGQTGWVPANHVEPIFPTNNG